VNNSIQLLALLDREFGFDDIHRSGFKKISEQYDMRSKEYVMLIEYRVKRRENMVSKGDSGQREQRLLKDINTLANQKYPVDANVSESGRN
jgi:hypothetical protein